ncbi:hypothetical protein DTO271D3_6270 [Paecilomyces variotii]|nr:hypothetical protein DTO271D3_6270 [Paecilomyces variotii]KAJ9379317.1 hypothetical protein DTO063F5_7200 [Paecilomyces variotii]
MSHGVSVMRQLATSRKLVAPSPPSKWVGSGIVLPLEHAQALVDLVASERATPSFVVSSIIDIEQVPEYYRRFSDHREHKVVIRFA